MSSKKILVLLGSVRDGRHGIKVANLMLKQLVSQGVDAAILDPLEIETPLMKQPLHFMRDPSSAPTWMTETSAKIKEASGFIIVSPEYNATICPALTNMMNYFPPAIYRHKPVSITTYSMGAFGGIRCQADLRPFVAELGLVSLPSVVVIPTIQNSGIQEDGTCSDERINKNVAKMCQELEWYVDAINAKKEAGGGYPN